MPTIGVRPPGFHSGVGCLNCYSGSNMKLGIDFGTTRIVVAASDRGNFPVVNF